MRTAADCLLSGVLQSPLSVKTGFKKLKMKTVPVGRNLTRLPILEHNKSNAMMGLFEFGELRRFFFYIFLFLRFAGLYKLVLRMYL